MRQFLKRQYLSKKKAAVAVLFIAAFFAGRGAARFLDAGESAPVFAEATRAALTVPARLRSALENRFAAGISSVAENWGLSFQEEGQPPVANATKEELAQYDAYYAGDTEEKVIYLTFDCGYENGNTPAILEALKKHGVSATFFVVGNFVSDNPELLRQMLAEGHTVGNHTAHHPDMSAIADMESFQAEIEELEKLFYEATGQEITKYYRPPQGKYSESNLSMAQQLGYKTFFWSLAYVDWYQDDQPTEEEAYEKLLGRIHPGAIVLLHNTSSTNAAILDELLTKWEAMGYRFGKLEELYG
ncbi:MAG: polysaccharide deacetylase family protein [Clostridiales bacterium]|nr:polysaccharide deacetylase family protein [Clostridiales bacterium]